MNYIFMSQKNHSKKCLCRKMTIFRVSKNMKISISHLSEWTLVMTSHARFVYILYYTQEISHFIFIRSKYGKNICNGCWSACKRSLYKTCRPKFTGLNKISRAIITRRLLVWAQWPIMCDQIVTKYTRFLTLQYFLWDKIARPHRKPLGLLYPLETCFSVESFHL